MFFNLKLIDTGDDDDEDVEAISKSRVSIPDGPASEFRGWVCAHPAMLCFID